MPDRRRKLQPQIENITKNVTGCTRCHGSHKVEIRELSRWSGPQYSPEKMFANWATCPATGEPILFHPTKKQLADRIMAELTLAC